jgi:hypothetical protein
VFYSLFFRKKLAWSKANRMLNFDRFYPIPLLGFPIISAIYVEGMKTAIMIDQPEVL